MSPSEVAYATIGTKTGKGRDTRRKTEALHVEDQDCEQRGVKHELVNDARARTYCRLCGRPWGDLDADLRGAP